MLVVSCGKNHMFSCLILVPISRYQTISAHLNHLHLATFRYSCCVVLPAWHLDNLQKLGGLIKEPCISIYNASPLKSFTSNTSAKLTTLIVAWCIRTIMQLLLKFHSNVKPEWIFRLFSPRQSILWKSKWLPVTTHILGYNIAVDTLKDFKHMFTFLSYG